MFGVVVGVTVVPGGDVVGVGGVRCRRCCICCDCCWFCCCIHPKTLIRNRQHFARPLISSRTKIDADSDQIFLFMEASSRKPDSVVMIRFTVVVAAVVVAVVIAAAVVAVVLVAVVVVVLSRLRVSLLMIEKLAPRV